jgi:hypothetical protein
MHSPDEIRWSNESLGSPFERNRSAFGGTDLDALEAVMIREEHKLGSFVGFALTGDALYEIDRFRSKEGREIKASTVREILDEQIAWKLA